MVGEELSGDARRFETWEASVATRLGLGAAVDAGACAFEGRGAAAWAGGSATGIARVVAELRARKII